MEQISNPFYDPPKGTPLFSNEEAANIFSRVPALFGVQKWEELYPPFSDSTYSLRWGWAIGRVGLGPDLNTRAIAAAVIQFTLMFRQVGKSEVIHSFYEKSSRL